jgi:hypothetical protein
MAKALGVPLASGVDLHDEVLGRTRATTIDDVALTLELPVLEHLSAADLLRFREAEGLHFERFRHALQQAINERLKEDPTTDAGSVAQAVIDDVINPELNSIAVKLEAADKALLGKAALHAGLGIATTTVGLLTAMPLIVGAGVSFLAGTAVHAGKRLDDQSQAVLSDMYFLWHAERMSKHSPSAPARRPRAAKKRRRR